jgi:predicted DNA binding CopG/RHH family protein
MPKTANKLKKTPKFKSEHQEREFWLSRDSTGYVDWSKAEPARLPNLRPTMRTVSIRLPEWMIERLKLLANKRDVPYQSLLKIFVAERLDREIGRSASS